MYLSNTHKSYIFYLYLDLNLKWTCLKLDFTYYNNKKQFAELILHTH